MFTVTIATDPADRARCLTLRRFVFIDEQGVPERDELDALDDVCTHFLAIDDEGNAIGTARLRFVDGHAKAQRVAVLAAWRGRGVGRALMRAFEAFATRGGAKDVVLSAQITAVPFYERLGYRAHGPVYDDAGIPHRDMSKPLDDPSGAKD